MTAGAAVARFAADFAAAVAADHALDPMGELVVWLHMALRREASVGTIYGVSNLTCRLERVRAPEEIIELLRTTISNIWAQEKAHAAYLEAVLSGLALPYRRWRWLASHADGFMGGIEGQVLSGLTSPRNLQRAKAVLMLAIGRRLHGVPEFVSSLSAMSFRDFCRLNAELEITAVHGYERILVLLEKVDRRSGLRRDTTLGVDLARMVRDERFHNEAFVAMADWFAQPTGNSLRAGISFAACSERLAAIRALVYRAEPASGDKPGHRWYSGCSQVGDGGAS